MNAVKPHIRIDDSHAESILNEITTDMRERHRLIDSIIATAADPAEARRIFLAARLIELLWLKSRRACREAAAEFGFKIDDDGSVRCADGE